MKKSLKELRNDIKKEVPFVDIKPYSHNIISICLQILSEDYGKDEANRAIRDFDLDKLGWREIK
jgi:hypothetical protein